MMLNLTTCASRRYNRVFQYNIRPAKVDEITETSKTYGLDIINKTKFMIISKENINGVHLYIDKTRIEHVTIQLPGNYNQ